MKGNYWVYCGPSKWLEYNESKGEKEVKEGALTCRMEITKVVKREAITAAVLQGFPSDLDWYDADHPVDQHLIVRVGSGTYYLFNGEDEVKKTLTKIQAMNADSGWYAEWLKDAEVWLDVPLMVDKRYGDPTELARGWYCWHVEAAEAFDDRSVRGLPRLNRMVYTVSNRTNPSRETIGVVQGVGLVSYQYVHHGTTAETDLKLVEAKLQPEKAE